MIALHNGLIPPQPSISPNCQQISSAVGIAIHIGFSTGIFCLAGSVLTIINPIGGAVFGATFSLTSEVTNKIIDSVGCNRDHRAFKIAKIAISVICSFVAAIFAVALIGSPITFAAATMLTGSAYLTGASIGGIVECVANCILAHRRHYSNSPLYCQPKVKMSPSWPKLKCHPPHVL